MLKYTKSFNVKIKQGEAQLEKTQMGFNEYPAQADAAGRRDAKASSLEVHVGIGGDLDRWDLSRSENDLILVVKWPLGNGTKVGRPCEFLTLSKTRFFKILDRSDEPRQDTEDLFEILTRPGTNETEVAEWTNGLDSLLKDTTYHLSNPKIDFQ